MQYLWQVSSGRLIIWLIVLFLTVAAAAIGLFFLGKIRQKLAQQAEKQRRTSDWLTDFRELHAKGELSNEEYRSIKSALAAQLREEVKDNGEKDSSE